MESPSASPSLNGNTNDKITVSQALHVYTEMLRRANLTGAGITFSGDRDLYATLGYKRDLDYDDYFDRYQRGGIAARIINAFPSSTWRSPPEVRDIGKPDEEQESPFETKWKALAKRLNLWQVFPRVDRLASLGQYAVLVIGLRNQTNWESEIGKVRSADDVLYIKSYSEQHTVISELVSDQFSPLFGLPKIYSIDFSRGGNTDLTSSKRPSLKGSGLLNEARIHASRIIHIAEDGLEDDIIGTPRLRTIWNYLDDLEKIMGGSAEMFWQDAKRRLVMAMQPDADMSTEEEDKLSDEVDEFVHEMKNFIRVRGIDVKELRGMIPDPSANVDKLLDLIAGAKGMPKRMLVGSERGELASSQDENNWAQRIMERRQQYAEPSILRAVIDKLILINALPQPKDGYEVEWEDLLAQSPLDKAKEALTWTQSLKEYAGQLGSPEDILPLPIFLEDVWGWDKKQVERILTMLGESIRSDMGQEADHQVAA